MAELKRGTADIVDVKRSLTDINYIYRATTLIWQRVTPVSGRLWITNRLQTVLSETNAEEDVYITSGLNLKFK
jgi:hypothetical protein